MVKTRYKHAVTRLAWACHGRETIDSRLDDACRQTRHFARQPGSSRFPLASPARERLIQLLLKHDETRPRADEMRRDPQMSTGIPTNTTEQLCLRSAATTSMSHSNRTLAAEKAVHKPQGARLPRICFPTRTVRRPRRFVVLAVPRTVSIWGAQYSVYAARRCP